MNSSIREIKEGRQEQGVEEEITYRLTVPDTWGVPTGTPIVKGYSYNETNKVYTDVTSTIFPSGAATVATPVITLPECKAMTVDVLYRVEIKFDTTNGDVKEVYAWIWCRR